MRLLPCGPGAVLAEYDTQEEVRAVSAALRTCGVPEIVDVVPAACTVLVRHRPLDPSVLTRLLTPGASAATADGALVEIPVIYDGDDVDAVAAATGLSAEQVIDAHSSVTYTAAFIGFTPGFAYLVGLPAALHLPRRSTPRTVVPAGSVAIAGEWTGVYPTASPGGWHLLGRTTARMFDIARPSPVLVAAGDRVRFVRS